MKTLAYPKFRLYMVGMWRHKEIYDNLLYMAGLRFSEVATPVHEIHSQTIAAQTGVVI